MKVTYREICSDILNDLKSFNLDDKISYRFIKNKLIDKASYFLKQDSKSREIIKFADYWKPLDCIGLEEVSISECGDIGCKKVMKSIEQIPSTLQLYSGNALKLFNIEYTKEYNLTQPYLYKDLINRQFKSKNGYFWIIDNYIYIPDSEVEFVIPFGIFREDQIAISNCKKPLDSYFSFPEYIVTLSKQEVLKELLGGYKQLVSDEKSDLNNNSK